MEKWITRGGAALCAAGSLALFWTFGVFLAAPWRAGRMLSLNSIEMQVLGVSLFAALTVAWGALHILAIADRADLFIAGMEMGNAFTELNDARDQEARFLDMAETFNKGDDDETLLDEDYLRAMRYGMPPNGGWGMGIDRLVMLMTDQHTIRDVLLYPHLRDEE